MTALDDVRLGQALLDIELPRPVANGVWEPEPGRAYRRAVRATVMSHLARLWERATHDLDLHGVALAIVGSFARGEGGPLSDVDVVLLHNVPRRERARIDEVVSRILYPLWDSGVGVDHSVRTPAQCRQIAKTDLPALTGLLDLRHVAGSRELTRSVRRAVGEDLRRQAPARIEELLRDARERWKHAGDIDLVNEPDLKDCRGGLRDLNLMRSLAATWLTDYPHERVERAAEMLCDVHDALQRDAARHTATLLRVHQPKVAAALGFSGEDRDAHLMRFIAAAGREIAQATDEVVVRAQGARVAWSVAGLRARLTRPRSPRLPANAPVLDELRAGIAEVDGSLVFTRAEAAKDPTAVLELGLTSARSGIGPSAATLADIAEDVRARRSQGRTMRWDERRRSVFLDMLGSGQGLIAAWFALERAGVPELWIPEWEALRSRPQRADFHRWTVDRHCVGTAAEMGRMLDGKADWLPPFDVAVVPRRTALLAALLHDLGKRPPGGGIAHPREGAALVPGVLARMGWASEARVVANLVKNHLVLAEAATSKDPNDPATIREVCDAAEGEPRVLATLISLTRADSVSAGERAWNPWRASLVNGLARACWDALTRE